MMRNRQKTLIFGGLSLLLVAAIAVSAWLAFFRAADAYQFKGGNWDPPHPAPALDLVDQNNQPFSLADHKGKVILLYFGYTYCPDYCPTTLSDFQKVKDELGDQADKVDVVFVTVDPDRDTPERMKEYLEFFNPAFIGLYGKPDQLTPIERDYGVTAIKDDATPGSSYYTVSHSTQLYAIDQEGNLRLTWAYGTSPDDMTADVRHLLGS